MVVTFPPIFTWFSNLKDSQVAMLSNAERGAALRGSINSWFNPESGVQGGVPASITFTTSTTAFDYKTSATPSTFFSTFEFWSREKVFSPFYSSGSSHGVTAGYQHHRQLLTIDDIFTPFVILILSCVGGGIVFCGLVYFLWFKVYLKSRRSELTKVMPIKYLLDPPPPEIIPPPYNPPRKLTKFEIRQKRLQKVMDDIQKRFLEQQNMKKATRTVHIAANIFNICCPCWCPKRPDYEEDFWDYQEEVRDPNRADPTAMVGDHSPEAKLKNKRLPTAFLNAEAKDGVDALADADNNFDIPIGASVFEIDYMKKANYIVNQRLKTRQNEIVSMEMKGEYNAVGENCGPSRNLRSNKSLPPNYEVEPIASIEPEILKRRVMYRFEDPEENRMGWYLGRVMSKSLRKGCNYNLKFEKFETGTAYVDGIENVNLQLHGENAYGRKWVLLRRTDGKATEPDELIHFAIFQTVDLSLQALRLANEEKINNKSKKQKNTNSNDNTNTIAAYKPKKRDNDEDENVKALDELLDDVMLDKADVKETEKKAKETQ